MSESGSYQQERGAPTVVFPTRVDAWLIAVIAVAIVLCLYQAWTLRHVASDASFVAMLSGVFSAVVVLAFTVPCRYTLEDDHLAIRCGLIRKRIPYAQIKRIELSSSAMSAPALSLRRVKIVHGRSFQLVSPRDRDRFIEELSKRAGLPV
ncbi:PH domain-containing protein [soil metagenome]